ncbi:hypothetical protein ABN034_22565 [Actinopolymorpha sp. B11F2]
MARRTLDATSKQGWRPGGVAVAPSTREAVAVRWRIATFVVCVVLGMMWTVVAR